MTRFAVIAAPVQAVDSEAPVWVEALPARVYQTPSYGEVPITLDKLQNFVTNFKSNVRGQEIATDFEHGRDPSKGTKASGWYRDMKIEPSSADPTQMSLWALVDLTGEAKKEIEDKQWRYFSLDWEDEWQDTDGNKYNDVVMGGALTNRPIAKKTLPINFSEVVMEDEERQKILDESKEMEHSEPGTGTPPAPRTDEDGSDDIAITEAWRRPSPPPQEWGTEGTPSSLFTKSVPLVPNSATTIVPKGGSRGMSEYVFAETQAQEVLRVLELPVDAKPDAIVETTKRVVGELTTLRQSADRDTQEKVFAEQYPAFWGEHNKLMERDRENTARNFSESAKTVRRAVGNGLVDTNQGLSAAAQTKVIEMHKKFAEGTATIEDFEECIKAITNGGIVTFGELGSGVNADEPPNVDTSSANGVAQARRAFSEVVAKLQEEDKDLSIQDAMQKAAEKYPDLAQAYRITLPA